MEFFKKFDIFETQVKLNMKKKNKNKGRHQYDNAYQSFFGSVLGIFCGAMLMTYLVYILILMYS